MKALDTNILVRFLTRDDPDQSQLVFQMFKQAEIVRIRYFVTVLVVLELIWVLESAYKVERSEIIKALSGLMSLPVLIFEKEHELRDMLQDAATNDCDLSDLLIAWTANSGKIIKTLTFDRKAAQHYLFELLKPQS